VAPNKRRGRVSAPVQAALSGLQRKVPALPGNIYKVPFMPQPSATEALRARIHRQKTPRMLLILLVAGGRIELPTYGVMNPPEAADSKQNQQLSSAESGK